MDVSRRSASPRPASAAANSRSAHQLANGVNSLINSHKHALAQHHHLNNSNQTTTNIPQPNTNGLKQSVSRMSAINQVGLGSGKTSSDQMQQRHQYTPRRDAVDKSASADSHISQLKMVSVTLGEVQKQPRYYSWNLPAYFIDNYKLYIFF